MILEMTEQEIFDKVVAHMRKQKCLSTKDNLCFYRGDNNTSCVIGCLIPDEIYKPEMEGNSINELIEDFPEIERYFSNIDTEFLFSIQARLHDTLNSLLRQGGRFTLENFEIEAENFAKDYGLKYTTNKS